MVKPAIVSLRGRWAGAPPPVGAWIATAKGGVFRVLELRPGGATCARYASAPPGVILRQWSDLVVRDASPPASHKLARRDHLQRLLRSGLISERHYVAATRFRALLEASVPPVPIAVGRAIRAQGVREVSPHDGHLRARRAVERALQAVGPDYLPVLDWCVVSNGSVSGYAAEAHTRRMTAADHLRGALARLDAHYNPPVVGRRR